VLLVPYPEPPPRYSVFLSFKGELSGYDVGMETERAVCESFQQAAQLVGRRWVPQIVWVLLDGPHRYSAIRAAIPEISDTLLSERLRELETAGIVTRAVTPSTPVLIEYTLTERGRDLATVVDGLSSWAERWAAVSV
jgi:DNA-binding HxlR family transcriptional regulator